MKNTNKPGFVWVPYVTREATNEDHENFIKEKEINGYETKRSFHLKHKRCPNCGNDQIRSTILGIVEYNNKDYYDDHNVGECIKCGWKGTVNKLIK